MPASLIEPPLPGASALPAGEPHRWDRSRAAGDKLSCTHEVESADTVHLPAREGGFPPDSRTEAVAGIGPETTKG